MNSLLDFPLLAFAVSLLALEAATRVGASIKARRDLPSGDRADFNVSPRGDA